MEILLPYQGPLLTIVETGMRLLPGGQSPLPRIQGHDEGNGRHWYGHSRESQAKMKVKTKADLALEKALKERGLTPGKKTFPKKRRLQAGKQTRK